MKDKNSIYKIYTDLNDYDAMNYESMYKSYTDGYDYFNDMWIDAEPKESSETIERRKIAKAREQKIDQILNGTK